MVLKIASASSVDPASSVKCFRRASPIGPNDDVSIARARLDMMYELYKATNDIGTSVVKHCVRHDRETLRILDRRRFVIRDSLSSETGKERFLRQSVDFEKRL
jgi:hypothetical protein